MAVNAVKTCFVPSDLSCIRVRGVWVYRVTGLTGGKILLDADHVPTHCPRGVIVTVNAGQVCSGAPPGSRVIGDLGVVYRDKVGVCHNVGQGGPHHVTIVALGPHKLVAAKDRPGPRKAGEQENKQTKTGRAPESSVPISSHGIRLHPAIINAISLIPYYSLYSFKVTKYQHVTSILMTTVQLPQGRS
jgi:hypothetical protein